MGYIVVFFKSFYSSLTILTSLTILYFNRRFHGTKLYKVTFFTSWWPKKLKAHQQSSEDSSTLPTKGRGRGLGKWETGRGGRFATSWKGSNFSLSTSHFRESRSSRQSYHESSGSGNVMYRRSDYHGQGSSFSEHATQKSDRDPSPGSSSSQTSISRRRSPQKRKVVAVDSLNISPKRVRHISMASSSSESNSERGSDKRSNSSSSSIRSYPRITSPIRVDSDGNNEPKSEGRVLRSHSNQMASDNKKQTKSSLTLTAVSQSQSKPTGSRYNTRSKKRNLEKEDLPSPKRHQASRVKNSKVKDNGSVKKLGPGPILRKRENIKREISLERMVVTTKESSHLSVAKLSMAVGSQESSQSEEEVWVEKSVALKTTQEVEKQNLSSESTMKITDKAATGDRVAGMNTVSASVIENIPGSSKQDIQKVGINPRATSLTLSTTELTNVLNSPMLKVEKEVLEPKMVVMPLNEDRDETPPAELLEATQQYMVQGDYSRWYRENFENDPQAWQRYCEYYNAIMMTGGGDGHVSATNAASILPAAGLPPAILAPEEGGSMLQSQESVSTATLQRTQSMPQVSLDSKSVQGESVQGESPPARNCKSMSPDLTDIELKMMPLNMASKAANPPSTNTGSGLEIPMSLSFPTSVQDSAIQSNAVAEEGIQVGPSVTHRSETSSQQWQSRSFRISKKYGHLQRQALRKFLDIAKPLIVSTQTLTRYSSFLLLFFQER